MNALTRSARTMIPRVQAQARSASNSATPKVKSWGGDFNAKHWASDPGAYPVMGICTFAVGFCIWKLGHAMTNQDVRPMPGARQNLIRPFKD
eukprot:CAMPEP_0197736412 /NCGR_PEP_ID=MMETSP1435-20131217/1693_1 /TAXON_ID=426625 /ORGANISM="Chaetoceros brevis, Strain CCMP164" /LENGTH=91 /DNA_ID=CAMNT_0043324545 /DNA_START=31 /DNA_END=306 /DNA_ORIENTATION=+